MLFKLRQVGVDEGERSKKQLMREGSQEKKKRRRDMQEREKRENEREKSEKMRVREE